LRAISPITGEDEEENQSVHGGTVFVLKLRRAAYLSACGHFLHLSQNQFGFGPASDSRHQLRGRGAAKYGNQAAGGRHTRKDGPSTSGLFRCRCLRPLICEIARLVHAGQRSRFRVYLSVFALRLPPTTYLAAVCRARMERWSSRQSWPGRPVVSIGQVFRKCAEVGVRPFDSGISLWVIRCRAFWRRSISITFIGGIAVSLNPNHCRVYNSSGCRGAIAPRAEQQTGETNGKACRIEAPHRGQRKTSRRSRSRTLASFSVPRQAGCAPPSGRKGNPIQPRTPTRGALRRNPSVEANVHTQAAFFQVQVRFSRRLASTSYATMNQVPASKLRSAAKYFTRFT